MASMRNPQWGNEAFALRYKQVDSLRQYFSTLKEVAKDSIYEVAITLPSRQAITLRIMLGPEFPYAAPRLVISPPVAHRHVNEQSVVLPLMHEKLQAWNVHTNLGKTVFEISQRLIQDQPQILNNYNGGYQNTTEPPPPYGIYGNGTNTPTTNQPNRPAQTTTPTPSPAASAQIRTPAIPTSFPELESKSVAELTELLNNEDQFQALFDSLEVVKTMRQIRDDLRDGNEQLAKKNVERTGTLEGLVARAAEARGRLATVQSSVASAASLQASLQEALQPHRLVERLQEAATQAEAESDEIASAFLDGTAQDDYKEFIKKFTEKRKLYHLRAAKKESTLMSLHQKRQ